MTTISRGRSQPTSGQYLERKQRGSFADAEAYESVYVGVVNSLGHALSSKAERGRTRQEVHKGVEDRARRFPARSRCSIPHTATLVISTSASHIPNVGEHRHYYRTQPPP